MNKMQENTFSVLNRENQLNHISEKKFDLVIIGGGVTGAGIALDAASRGMKTCLIEKNDFASGTSNKSTKLIHGGLRYLKQFEIGLVKESGRERAIVHKLAPHLVIPEKMLLPLIEGGTYGKIMTAIGLKVYDILANVEGDDKRKMLDKDETLEKEPLLDPENVLAGGFYSEYRTDDARLTIELLKKAASFGATLLNYCEMDTFVYNEKGILEHLDCKDHTTGKTLRITGRNFVSAAGPWVDTLRKKDKSINEKYLHLTKGVHLVFPFDMLPIAQSIYFDVPDGRMLFAIPRGRCTYVGTTDTTYTGDLDRVLTTQADVAYLLNAMNTTFPTVDLSEKDIESSWAGLRPLIHEKGKNPSELSRKDEIFVSDSGLISIAGGKLTGYRKMSQRVLEAVLKSLPKKRKKKLQLSETENIALTSDPFQNKKEVAIYQEKLQQQLKNMGFADPYIAMYLVVTYGKQTDLILRRFQQYKDKDLIKSLVLAELWYTVHYEMVASITDFFVRRTARLFFDIKTVSTYKEIVLEELSNYLNWNEEKQKSEAKMLSQLIKDATTFYVSEAG
ncbi:FAD-dependent oxidoreductase [Jejudonia soesokkakensis]|uniref:Glycerol-3-phosphate dehydrogenase n=1 Tax=Jejudonia soesokkakensis TaxID=1323432 RepID=A0ABW2MUJ3_9FLAO